MIMTKYLPSFFQRFPAKPGFALIELLVVIAIIAILAAGSHFSSSKSVNICKCPADIKMQFDTPKTKLATTRSMSRNAWMNPLPNSANSGFGGGVSRIFQKQADIVSEAAISGDLHWLQARTTLHK